VFGSNRPEFGWKRQKAKVSVRGSPRYAKYGYKFIVKSDTVALLKAKRQEPFSMSLKLGSKLPEDGGSDCLSTAME
jgi:hypothetical protein